MNKQFVGFIYGVFSAFIWSINYLIPKAIDGDITPIAINTSRWLLAFLVLLPFCFKYFNRPHLRLFKKNFIYFSIVGITGISLQNSLIYVAGETSPPLNLSLISITAPIFILLIAVIFLKRKIHLKEFFGILITVIGVLFLITDASIKNLMDLNFKKGDLYMLLSAISFAVYSIFIKSKPENISGHFLLFSSILFGLIYMLPFSIYDYSNYKTSYDFNEQVVYAILYSGIFSSLIGYYLWNKAICLIGVVKTSSMYYLIPVFSSLLAVIFFNESLYYYDLISLFLIMSGVYITSSHETVRKKTNQLKMKLKK
ncbi:DMT family transporter [Aureivirga marina]|uniref:DMT family transporter n=1 Tax=Aureivirga marina TaxID=1182451 RepID=UPI0018CA04B1|nr:DMT family transporter [Aureivirga marina]